MYLLVKATKGRTNLCAIQVVGVLSSKKYKYISHKINAGFVIKHNCNIANIKRITTRNYIYVATLENRMDMELIMSLPIKRKIDRCIFNGEV